MIINVPEVYLQTVFYSGFSKQTITSVQALILVLIVDKSVNHVLYRNFVTAAAWCGLMCKANGMAIVFPFGRRWKKDIVLQCFFGCDFLSSHTAIVSGITNYPSTCIYCCSNDLSLLLRSLKLRIRECIIPRTNFCLYSWPKWHI